MPTIVVASYAQSVWPGIRTWFGTNYDRYSKQWTEIFDQYTSDKQFEREMLHRGTGLLQVKPETSALSYSDMAQIRAIEYRHTTYALAMSVSLEAIDDNQYPELALARAGELGTKAALTQEIVAAVYMSRVFSTNREDGVPLCSTAHPLGMGGTAANRPTNGSDLSEASLEQAVIDIKNTVDETNNKIALKPTKLIIPNSLMFEAKRILGNPDRPETANRDINALYHLGSIPTWTVNDYLEDQDAWFIKTDCSNGMKHFQRWPVELVNESGDFDTFNMRMKVFYRDSFGASDWRGIWGNPGA